MTIITSGDTVHPKPASRQDLRIADQNFVVDETRLSRGSQPEISLQGLIGWWPADAFFLILQKRDAPQVPVGEDHRPETTLLFAGAPIPETASAATIQELLTIAFTQLEVKAIRGGWTPLWSLIDIEVIHEDHDITSYAGDVIERIRTATLALAVPATRPMADQ